MISLVSLVDACMWNEFIDLDDSWYHDRPIENGSSHPTGRCIFSSPRTYTGGLDVVRNEYYGHSNVYKIVFITLRVFYVTGPGC